MERRRCVIHLSEYPFALYVSTARCIAFSGSAISSRRSAPALGSLLVFYPYPVSFCRIKQSPALSVFENSFSESALPQSEKHILQKAIFKHALARLHSFLNQTTKTLGTTKLPSGIIL